MIQISWLMINDNKRVQLADLMRGKWIKTHKLVEHTWSQQEHGDEMKEGTSHNTEYMYSREESTSSWS